MENSNNKNILLTFIIVVFILFASFITFLFLNKDIQLNQNVDSTKESTDKIEDSIIIDQEKNIIIRSKFIDRNGETFNYVTIEYTPDNSAESYILKILYDDKPPLDKTGYPEEDRYEIVYLSDKYLVVRVIAGLGGPPYDLLFNLSTLREEIPSVDDSGTYTFYDNDKYIIFKSSEFVSSVFGRDFITVEVVNGKPIQCILTEKPTTDDITIKDGIISFTEITYSEDGKDVKTEKNININDFCKDQ